MAKRIMTKHLVYNNILSMGTITHPIYLHAMTRVGSWWRHQMEAFSAKLAICAGNSPVTGEFPAQRPVTRSFDVSFDLRLNKRLRKQSWSWWFETLSRPLWRQCDDIASLGQCRDHCGTIAVLFCVSYDHMHGSTCISGVCVDASMCKTGQLRVWLNKYHLWFFLFNRNASYY